MAIKLHDSFAVRPGEWLRTEIVEPAGLSVSVLSNQLGVTRAAANKLIYGGASLTGEVADRFEKVFELRADTLMRMQVAHELANLKAREV